MWVIYIIKKQETMILSEYSGIYDLVVPKDNMLRKINELIDFSFIYDEILDKYCSRRSCYRGKFTNFTTISLNCKINLYKIIKFVFLSKLKKPIKFQH